MATRSEFAYDGLEVVPTVTYSDGKNTSQSQNKVVFHEVAAPGIHDRSVRRERVSMSTKYWIGIVVLLVLAIAALGGALGNGLAVCNNSRDIRQSSGINASSNTPVPTTTLSTIPVADFTSSSIPSATASTKLSNFAVPAPNDINTLAVNCQSSIAYVSQTNDHFGMLCGIDIGNAGGAIKDLVSIVAYTVSDCMEACSRYSFYNGNRTCQAVTWWPNLAFAYAARTSNCWLKNATGPGSNTPWAGSGGVYATSAQILGL